MTKPRFKKGDEVVVAITDGKIGTIARTPKMKSTGFLFGGGFAYDVEFADGGFQRLRENHLAPVGQGGNFGK